VLVVDDSAYNRRTVADVFAGAPDIEVVGKAADGEEALLLATLLKPDVITLDLEMPRMDGFTFLRILMAKQPTPVIVVSSYSQKENVFKALELGALDFVAKPDQRLAPGAGDIKDEILSKVRLVRAIRPTLFPNVKRAGSGLTNADGKVDAAAVAAIVVPPPRYVVAIASSTGGPSALLEVFAKIPGSTPAGFLVAQHMPDKFTRTFAERIDRRGAVRVTEGQDGDALGVGIGFVCPGRQCMELVAGKGPELRIRVGPAKATDRYVPSADRLLTSVAKSAPAAGSRAVGVVLTGMGDDGLAGARAIKAAGGMVIAESAETAVVYGMPGAVVREGLADKVLPLGQVAELLASFMP
jgi:two-component system chemotaxis response regulator CheB